MVKYSSMSGKILNQFTILDFSSFTKSKGWEVNFLHEYPGSRHTQISNIIIANNAKKKDN